MRIPPVQTAVDDPRDAPGTDDHVRLVHPHGSAFCLVGPYRADDLEDYARAVASAHSMIVLLYVTTYLGAGLLPRPVCGVHHAEPIRDVTDLPHGNRAGVLRQVREAEASAGGPVGLVRVWRHLGVDCEEAELTISCEHE